MKKLFSSLVIGFIFIIATLSLFHLFSNPKNRLFTLDGQLHFAPDTQEHLDLYKVVSSLQNYSGEGLFSITWETVVDSYEQVRDSNLVNSGAVGSIVRIANGQGQVYDYFSAFSFGIIIDVIITPTMMLYPILIFVFYVIGTAFAYIGIAFNIFNGDFFFTQL